MPIQTCQKDGKQGYRWGRKGACFVHDGSEEGRRRARAKALRQARAIIAHGGEKSMFGDMLINFGGEVKAVGDSGVEGYIVRFSTQADPDLTRDFFTRETDFDMEFPGKSSVYYDHGMNAHLKRRKIGKATLATDETGVFVKAELEKRDQYEAKVLEMAKAGKLGWSSGTANHLVEREPVGEAKRIVSWPLGLDASLTPTPAEPRNLAVVSVKAYYGTDSEENGSDLLTNAAADDILAASEIKTERDFEALLRDLGWPKAAAVTIASKGFSALVRRDSGERVSEADRLLMEQIRFAAQRRLRNLEWTGELRL